MCVILRRGVKLGKRGPLTSPHLDYKSTATPISYSPPRLFLHNHNHVQSSKSLPRAIQRPQSNTDADNSTLIFALKHPENLINLRTHPQRHYSNSPHTDMFKPLHYEVPHQLYYHGPRHPHLRHHGLRRSHGLRHLPRRLRRRCYGLLLRRGLHVGRHARCYGSRHRPRVQRGVRNVPGGVCSCVAGSAAVDVRLSWYQRAR
jgi:hypothetical protein